MEQNNKSIAKLFEENELKISQLYAQYSQLFPDHEDFWKKISEEEIIHAREISNLSQEIKECFTENKFSRGVIRYVSDFVEKQIEIAKDGNLSLSDAFNSALRIEQSILEKKCFEMFIPTTVTIKEVLERLNRDTQRHADQLRKELKKIIKK
jgi:rubrerythrin